MAIEKKLYRSGPYADLFSQGVHVASTIYTAVQIGPDAAGHAPDGLVEHMQHAYRHVAAVLAELDCSMHNSVEETGVVTDMHEWLSQAQALLAARHAIHGQAPEVAQTLVQVVSLVDPAFKIEINCVAMQD